MSNPLNNKIMKKVFLLLCLMATTSIVMATDLWEGTHAVAWDNTLTIEAAKFAEAQVGQKIVVGCLAHAMPTPSMLISTKCRYSSPQVCWLV